MVDVVLEYIYDCTISVYLSTFTIQIYLLYCAKEVYRLLA